MVFSLLKEADWSDVLGGLNNAANQLGYASILATAAAIYTGYKLVYAFYLSPLRNIPGPFLARFTKYRAELIGILGSQARFARKEYEQYGDVYIHQPNAIAISNPTDVRIVYGSHAFQKSKMFDALKVLGEHNTVSAREPQLASMKRRLLGPYFNSAYLARAEPLIAKHGILAIKEKWDRLLEQSNSGAEINFHKDLLLATFDTIGALAFGRGFGALKNDDATVAKWMSSALSFHGVQAIFPLLSYFPFSLLLWPLKFYYSKLVAHSAKCLAARQELLKNLTEEKDRPADLLQGLFDAFDPETKTGLTPRQVQAESIMLLVAGSETSSNTLAITLHLLMLYPHHYKRAVEEVRSAFDKDHFITYSEAKAKLPFIEACIYESLRAYPVSGGLLTRLAPKEGFTLSSGHFIPGGTEVNVNMSGVNLHKDAWKEPHLFDPTRFLDSDEAKRNVFTFGTGVRVCSGRQLAWIEMFTILANILKDYDFKLPDDYTLRGPDVLDERGYPKLMDTVHFLATIPENPARDCRLVISRPR